jgi:hypothetical protein
MPHANYHALKPKPSGTIGSDVRCHWCDYIYRLRHDMTCTRCHVPFNAEKVATAKIRNEKGYKERLTVDEQKRLKFSRSGYIDGAMKGLNKQLNKYLESRKAISLRSFWPTGVNCKKKDRTE